ncbi:MAG: D-alanine--D-alanine ligase [Acidobacteria bacterium]|nr:D-alanine--D-alanine ligase [Acidobacteriota bacterium]
MRIGFTYDLRDDYLAQGFSLEQAAEFDTRETVNYIHEALEANGYVVERIGGVKALVQALASGKRWDLVFNICEGVRGVGREAQVPCLLEAYGIPMVFSPSDTMVVTMDKSLAKLVVREAGVPTAGFRVIRQVEDLERFDLAFPVFAKPLAEGTGKGISANSWVSDLAELKQTCLSLLTEFHQPVLVETYLAGRDLTVGIIGSGESARVIGVLETLSKEGAEAGGQGFYNKENCEEVLEYVLIEDDLADHAARVALDSWRALGCLDAGRVDLRCDHAGIPHFLEVNPLAGLHPYHSDLPILAAKAGLSYHQLMGNIVKEALTRLSAQIPLDCCSGS